MARRVSVLQESAALLRCLGRLFTIRVLNATVNVASGRSFIRAWFVGNGRRAPSRASREVKGGHPDVLSSLSVPILCSRDYQ